MVQRRWRKSAHLSCRRRCGLQAASNVVAAHKRHQLAQALGQAAAAGPVVLHHPAQQQLARAAQVTGACRDKETAMSA